MVYNKCMRLASWSPDQEISEQSPLLQNQEDSSASQSGLLLNLMSQDTYNIMSSVWIFHYVWAIPLKVSYYVDAKRFFIIPTLSYIYFYFLGICNSISPVYKIGCKCINRHICNSADYYANTIFNW